MKYTAFTRKTIIAKTNLDIVCVGDLSDFVKDPEAFIKKCTDKVIRLIGILEQKAISEKKPLLAITIQSGQECCQDTQVRPILSLTSEWSQPASKKEWKDQVIRWYTILATKFFNQESCRIMFSKAEITTFKK